MNNKKYKKTIMLEKYLIHIFCNRFLIVYKASNIMVIYNLRPEIKVLACNLLLLCSSDAENAGGLKWKGGERYKTSFYVR